jgi:hypothetical protein
MTPEELGAIAALVLSLAMSYIPGLKEWYAGQSGEHKALIMLGLLVLVSGGAFGLACAGMYPELVCDQAGLMGLIKVFVVALIANQSAYTISRKIAPAKKPEVIG